MIAPLNVKYVILAKEADYEEYDFLYRQNDLEVVFSGQTLILFANEHTVNNIYSVNEITHNPSPEEIIKGLAPILSDTKNGASAAEVTYTQMSRIRFKISSRENTLVALTLP